jgi:hypothetical protein|mmetsp:Transcript_48739/g.75904  ORF Transcript_48739/g.75904 Transcript_48739/m.75904 type:complete len:524 (-) Transcript_48739:17-1588(-)
MVGSGPDKEELPARPGWGEWCCALTERCSAHRVAKDGKSLHDNFQRYLREMCIGKASAVMLGFILKLSLVLTVLHASQGLGGLRIDKHGNPVGPDQQDFDQSMAIVISNMIVFFILLAFSSVIATTMSSCTRDQKELDKELEEADEVDASDVDESENMREFKYAERKTYQEMCKTYIGGSKLLPAWAWKDFVASLSLACLTSQTISEAPEDLQANSTTINLTTTIGANFTTISMTTTAVVKESAKIFNLEADMQSAVIALVIILVSAVVSLAAEDLAHCIGSCKCIKTAFDTWSTCMALTAGWALNNVVDEVTRSKEYDLGAFFRISYLIVLMLAVHFIQTRLTWCRAEFENDKRYHPKTGEIDNLPHLPQICKKVQQLLVQAGDFIIAWAWRDLLDKDFFGAFDWSQLQQAVAVSLVGVAILCIWPCCCDCVGDEFEGVVHTTIGINIGWFWTDYAHHVFKEHINHEDGISIYWVWIGTFLIVAVVVAFCAALEFIMICLQTVVENWAAKHHDLLASDSDEE